jgi:dTDP-4-dehydrorhamnose reductase
MPATGSARQVEAGQLMRVLITGREGQVARALRERASRVPDLELIAMGRPELDLVQPGSAAAAVHRTAPDVVISAAAYTAVDQAEDEPDIAVRVNGEAPEELADAARAVGAPIIHFSTDYVFDGRKPGAYSEEDPVAPLGVYGRSKLQGEVGVRAANPDHLILRTAWVYSPWGKNFVRTMVRLAADRDSINVVSDQRGNPTSALDLADAVMAVLEHWRSAKGSFGSTLHLVGSGSASWSEFADHIMTCCHEQNLPSAQILPISTEQYPTRAERPRNSRLSVSAFWRNFGFELPDWRDSTRDTVNRIAAGER